MREIRQIELPERVEAEPFYIAQTDECTTPYERMTWLREVAAEAAQKGGVHGRATLGCYGNPDLLLFESWNVLPVSEGEPRFQLTAA